MSMSLDSTQTVLDDHSDTEITSVSNVVKMSDSPENNNQNSNLQCAELTYEEKQRNLLFDSHFCINNSCTILHNNGKIYYCNICGVEKSTIESFIKHRYMRHLNQLHKCYYCGMRFGTSYLLMEHFVEFHRYSKICPFACYKCGLIFSDFKMFEDHLTTRRCCYFN